jgi:hypothetical protein
MQLTGRREPILMSGAGKAAGRHTPPQAALFCGNQAGGKRRARSPILVESSQPRDLRSAVLPAETKPSQSRRKP